MMNLNTRFALLSGLATLAFSPAQAQVSNGSFELPTLPSAPYYQVAAPAGWTGTNVEHFDPALYDAVLGAASDGLLAVDLAFNTGGTLSQVLSTSVSQWYQVSFDMGNSNYVGRSGASTIDVTVDGFSGSFSIGAATQTAIDWQNKTFMFQATTLTPTLTFSNSQDQLQVFAFLDNVQVTAVPEPETLAMLLAGLGVVAGVAKRRGLSGV